MINSSYWIDIACVGVLRTDKNEREASANVCASERICAFMYPMRLNVRISFVESAWLIAMYTLRLYRIAGTHNNFAFLANNERNSKPCKEQRSWFQSIHIATKDVLINVRAFALRIVASQFSESKSGNLLAKIDLWCYRSIGESTRRWFKRCKCEQSNYAKMRCSVTRHSR